MPIVRSAVPDATEQEALEQISQDGFAAVAKDYATGKTEPHRHDHDICLHILEGEFRLGALDDDAVHTLTAGDRVFVPAGTLHYEDHGPLRMVVGRRQPEQGRAPSCGTGGA